MTDSVNTPITRWNCATNSWRQTRVMMNDLTEIQNAIDDLTQGGVTSIDLGVRMGGLYFDPSMRDAINILIDNNQISEDFRDYPNDWEKPGVYRAMILMTDGQNCCGNRGTHAVQNQRTVSSCAALRDQGVNIYAVAFEAPASGVSMMQQCASSPNHFFNGSGSDLVDAFASIATHIHVSTLRLTQCAGSRLS